MRAPIQVGHELDAADWLQPGEELPSFDPLQFPKNDTETLPIKQAATAARLSESPSASFFSCLASTKSVEDSIADFYSEG